MATRTARPWAQWQEMGRPHLDAAIAALPDESTQDDLIARYVEPGDRGRDRARVVAEAGAAPIWALIGHMRGGDGIEDAADAYALPLEAAVAAVAYYDRHRDLIDARLLLNDEAFT